MPLDGSQQITQQLAGGLRIAEGQAGHAPVLPPTPSPLRRAERRAPFETDAGAETEHLRHPPRGLDLEPAGAERHTNLVSVVNTTFRIRP